DRIAASPGDICALALVRPSAARKLKGEKGHITVENRKTFLYAAIAALMVLAGFSPLVAEAGTVTPNIPAQVGQDGGEEQPVEETADPSRAAFDVARDALEEARGLDLSLVTAWAYEEAEWVGGID